MMGDAGARLYEGDELEALRKLVTHVIPVPAYMLEKLRNEFTENPFRGEIVLARIRGTQALIPCGEAAGAILEVAPSVLVRLEEVEDHGALTARVAASTRPPPPAQLWSPVRSLQLVLAVTGMSVGADAALRKRVKAAHAALSGIWSDNRLLTVVGPPGRRSTTPPSPFTCVAAEGPLEGVFAELVKFDEVVCSGKIRPCVKSFKPSLVVSFKFILSVYTSTGLAEAKAAINARLAAYKDLTLKTLNKKKEKEDDESAEGGGESEHDEANESDEESEDKEIDEEVPEDARDEFEKFLEAIRERFGKRTATLLVREANKRMRCDSETRP